MTPAVGTVRQLDITKSSPLSNSVSQALATKVVGQDKATQALVDILDSFLAGMCDPRRPAGNALFLGPTGTGKTHVVESFAESLFGNSQACLRIDCSEFQHSHEIAKLIGSPPGYLGHNETHPIFTEERLAKFHTEHLKLSIVLFDEIEKASDNLWNLLLGILDNATVTTGTNKVVDFRKTIIVMTSNVGAKQMGDRGLGFAEQPVAENAQRLEEIATSAAKSKFSPEFMNRIENLITFQPLTPEQIEKILDIELKKLERRLYLGDFIKGGIDERFSFSLSKAARAKLIDEGYNPTYGARHLRRTIQRRLQRPLAKLVASNQISNKDVVNICDNGGDDFDFSINSGRRPDEQ